MKGKIKDVAIIGYGTAGQALALLLARDGHRVQVFEQAPRMGPVGAGFLLQPTGLQVLWELGLLEAAITHGRRIERLYGETPSGRAVMDMRYAGLGGHLFGLGMQRGALFQLMAQARPARVQVHEGRRIVSVDSDQGRVRDAQGREEGPFDLVIAADGSASQLRAQVGAVRRDRPYPWGALWCLVAQADWAWPQELRQRYVAARKMIGMLPVGTRPDDPTPQLSFFWSLPSDGYAHFCREGMPAWQAEVAAIWPHAAQRVAHLGQTDALARAAYRDATVQQWANGRLVLAGDAAHAMSPQLGQGVNMALLDAMALRDALRLPLPVPAALASYQRERAAHVRIYQFWSRWLTPVFQSERDLLARVRDLAFLPLGRLPGGRGHMLRVLSGTQQGVLGQRTLAPRFLQALRSLTDESVPRQDDLRAHGVRDDQLAALRNP